MGPRHVVEGHVVKEVLGRWVRHRSVWLRLPDKRLLGGVLSVEFEGRVSLAVAVCGLVCCQGLSAPRYGGGGGRVCCVYLQLDAFLTFVRRRGRKVLEVHRHTGGRDIAALTEPHAHEGIPVVIDDDVGVVPGVGGVFPFVRLMERG